MIFTLKLLPHEDLLPTVAWKSQLLSVFSWSPTSLLHASRMLSFYFSFFICFSCCDLITEGPLCNNPGSPGTDSVDQAGLELIEINLPLLPK